LPVAGDWRCFLPRWRFASEVIPSTVMSCTCQIPKISRKLNKIFLWKTLITYRYYCKNKNFRVKHLPDCLSYSW
jgi:hypothetical protein